MHWHGARLKTSGCAHFRKFALNHFLILRYTVTYYRWNLIIWPHCLMFFYDDFRNVVESCGPSGALFHNVAEEAAKICPRLMLSVINWMPFTQVELYTLTCLDLSRKRASWYAGIILRLPHSSVIPFAIKIARKVCIFKNFFWRAWQKNPR